MRSPHQGIKAARSIVRQLGRRGHGVTPLDPQERPPLLDRMHEEYSTGTSPEPLARIAGQIRAADPQAIRWRQSDALAGRGPTGTPEIAAISAGINCAPLYTARH